jgi:inhibitor of KinA
LTAYNLIYKPYGKHAILIEWPTKIDKNILKNILNYKNSIIKKDIKVIVDIVSTYSSLTIFYVTTIENIYNEIKKLKAIYDLGNVSAIAQNTLWKIPVCYDPVFGVDLDEISLKKNIEIDRITELHFRAVYTVYFIGFLPGFLYLGGLDEKLFFPRKANPRLQVQKGAVGIGGEQTGVYPQESAGGWNIIGNSPISFFDRKKEQPCFAEAGDLIQFVPIGIEEHQEITDLVSYKRYKIEKEIIDA